MRWKFEWDSLTSMVEGRDRTVRTRKKRLRFCFNVLVAIWQRQKKFIHCRVLYKCLLLNFNKNHLFSLKKTKRKRGGFHHHSSLQG